MNPQQTPTCGRLSDAEIAELEAHLQVRLHGRVRDFRLRVAERGLILTGYAYSYYAKQLAQQAVMEATEVPIAANNVSVR